MFSKFATLQICFQRPNSPLSCSGERNSLKIWSVPVMHEMYKMTLLYVLIRLENVAHFDETVLSHINVINSVLSAAK